MEMRAGMEAERRTKRRVEFDRPVALVSDAGEKLAARCYDFSMHGIGIATTYPLKVGDILHLTLNIAPAGKVNVLSLRGEIVHREYVAQIFRLGIRFYKNR